MADDQIAFRTGFRAALATFAWDAICVVALVAAAPWLLWSWLVRGRRRGGWSAKLFGRVPKRNGDKPCAWFHASSVGETNLIAPVVARFQAARPDWDVVVSVTTVAGHELACKKFGSDRVVWAPLDFSWAVRAAMERLRPDLLVLAELEVWPNWIAEAKRRGAKIAIVNGRLSERSYAGYQRFRSWVEPTFARLDLVAGQTGRYGVRFLALGVRMGRLRTTGSIKFDGAATDRANPETRRLKDLAVFSNDDVVFLAGSTQSPEESLALKTFQELAPRHPALRLVLVPRHPERFDDVARMLDASKTPWVRRSRLDDPATDRGARVLLVDTIGELGAWWGTATIGFVGGSLLNDRGGQNMIEPAAYGVATCFGPGTRNFREVVDRLQEADAAQVVASGAELTRFVERCLVDPAFTKTLGKNAAKVVVEEQGALDRTMDLLGGLLPCLPGDHGRVAA